MVLIKIVLGIWSFISSILLIADMIFDALQCKTYHDFANEKSPYEEIKISKWYFICSVAIWAVPPICLLVFHLIAYQIDPKYGQSWHNIEKRKSGDNFTTSVFIRPPWNKNDLELAGDEANEYKKLRCYQKILVVFFFYIFITTFQIYVIMPLMAVVYGFNDFISLFGFDIIKEIEVQEEKIDKKADKRLVSYLQLFEHIGEALPQIILTTVYYINNYDYIASTDFGFEVLGFLITQTLISIILSAISILKGIVTGMISCYKLKAWKAT